MFPCGNTTAKTEERVECLLAQHKKQNRTVTRLESIHVFVRFVLVNNGSEGIVPYDMRRRVVNALARAFQGIRFDHIGLNDQPVYSPDNFRMYPNSEEEKEIKVKYQRDPSAYVNIYSAEVLETYRRPGWATFPWDLEENPKLDGVVIDYRSLLDETKHQDVIHEVGHWFGLRHTFHNGCGPGGDYVDDTEAHQEPTEAGCPAESHNTCPSEERAPIHNFMNYTTCRTHFTPGQLDRIYQCTEIWRPRLLETHPISPV